MQPQKTSESQGTRLLRQLYSHGKHIFNTANAKAAATPERIPLRQLNKILFNLTKHELIHRLRRGLYVIVGALAEKKYPHPFAISTHLVQPSAISHWSALQHHGLTEQIPQVVTASTTSKVVTPTMRTKSMPSMSSTLQLRAKHAWKVGEVCYEYFTISKKHFFGIEKIWLDEHFQVQITDKERTIIDVFNDPKMFGGIGEALGILENALPNIDIQKLISYAIQYGKKSLIKRLGWALEYFAVADKFLSPLLTIPIGYYCRLDPCAPAKGSCDKRWMIQNNLTKEKQK
jgi:predicted transcriptional regulator of viral defense system